MQALPNLIEPPLGAMTRRSALLGAALLPMLSRAQAPAIDPDYWNRPRALWLQRQQTGESVQEVYFADGQVQWAGYTRVCQLLRDVTANVAVQIDVVLLDALCGAQGYLRAFGVQVPWVVTSGHRTAKTNAATEGAAKDSLHVLGRATDGFLPGLKTEHQAGLARMYLQGGLGWYPSRGFIHLDSGRVRSWRG